MVLSGFQAWGRERNFAGGNFRLRSSFSSYFALKIGMGAEMWKKGGKSMKCPRLAVFLEIRPGFQIFKAMELVRVVQWYLGAFEGGVE